MKNKVAVFIAAGTGIGANAAKHLSSRDYNVGILSSSGKGEELANSLGGIGLNGSNQSTTDIKNIIRK